MANSRVGEMQMTPVPFLVENLALCNNSTHGNRNARVFPLPVLAAPIKSLPVSKAGMACAWICVMRSNCISLRANCVFSERGRLENKSLEKKLGFSEGSFGVLEAGCRCCSCCSCCCCCGVTCFSSSFSLVSSFDNVFSSFRFSLRACLLFFLSFFLSFLLMVVMIVFGRWTMGACENERQTNGWSRSDEWTEGQTDATLSSKRQVTSQPARLKNLWIRVSDRKVATAVDPLRHSLSLRDKSWMATLLREAVASQAAQKCHLLEFARPCETFVNAPQIFGHTKHHEQSANKSHQREHRPSEASCPIVLASIINREARFSKLALLDHFFCVFSQQKKERETSHREKQREKELLPNS